MTFLARKTVDLESEKSMIDQIFEVFKANKKGRDPRLIDADDLMEILEELGEQYREEDIEKLLKESSLNGPDKNGKSAIGERGIAKEYSF